MDEIWVIDGTQFANVEHCGIVQVFMGETIPGFASHEPCCCIVCGKEVGEIRCDQGMPEIVELGLPKGSKMADKAFVELCEKHGFEWVRAKRRKRSG